MLNTHKVCAQDAERQVHVLNEERGPVIEAIVVRATRMAEAQVRAGPGAGAAAGEVECSDPHSQVLEAPANGPLGAASARDPPCPRAAQGAACRLVGLSATLPNPNDVARFLRVDLRTGPPLRCPPLPLLLLQSRPRESRLRPVGRRHGDALRRQARAPLPRSAEPLPRARSACLWAGVPPSTAAAALCRLRTAGLAAARAARSWRGGARVLAGRCGC